MATKSNPIAQHSQHAHTETTGLKEFFIDSLKDIYWAEKHLSKALPRMAQRATSRELKVMLQKHLSDTENQVIRLEQVFSSLNEKAIAKKCEAMDGLLREADTIIAETGDGSMTRDVGLITAAQKIEHYEIATYGTMKTLAEVLGFVVAADIFDQILQEEKSADVHLTQLAEASVNESALRETR
ncbi:MAG TPA: ferritin-like domain-containing protein [Daejeonella sp.]|nr:ferritin-like domain-containing protein [Daejeonella sp.]